MRNSALVSLAVTVFGVVLASTAAYAFSRFRFPGWRIGLYVVPAHRSSSPPPC